MKNIEIKILNPEAITNAEKMLVCAARLTQRGHSIKSLDDFMHLYEKGYSENTVSTLSALPHTTIQKFGLINVVIVGASRRFLAQITRHQNEVKFMSASLQYSNYSGEADFVVPYKILESGDDVIDLYKLTNIFSMKEYAHVAESCDSDSAGYLAPQGLRNILIISATPYQWKYMIHQRVCRRNTDETRYIMLRIWEQLYVLSPALFSDCGPFCVSGPCKEGKMSCKNPIRKNTIPTDILKEDFPLLTGGLENENKNN
ncbi:MAG: FAD-dependent thymidylate synthase [Clostridia bacterium]|nr:FAD-dependent thymidylate synthase [Clostridia bacterium]